MIIRNETYIKAWVSDWTKQQYGQNIWTMPKRNKSGYKPRAIYVSGDEKHDMNKYYESRSANSSQPKHSKITRL